tara:strand:+ start:640 stop:957 length:318 start_codon:yes stop_codon:yes gene_type:complete
MKKTNTKEKVKFWLHNHPDLRDDDNRLCSNIWAEEIDLLENVNKEDAIIKFLQLYASNKLTAAPSIKRARAKIQEENPEYRGLKYNLRKGKYQKDWRKKLGYENN